ncbi:MAG: MFS transporter [Pararhodobacter sp.]|nr:MFS transporter [Pararhodobacter sp.]
MRQLADFLRLNAPWLAAGFLLTFASSFGQTFFISVFAGEIRAEFGLSHGQWGAIYALATTASAATMIWAGSLTDRFRVRHIGIGVLAGLALTALAMAQLSHVWALIGAIYLLRLFGQGLMGHAAMVAMARWFVASRGRAVSVAGLGVAMGEAFLPLGFVALMGVFDWRLLWVFAAMALFALAPVLWALLRRERTPQSFAAETGSTGLHGRMWTRAQVLRHPAFWLMVPVILGPAAWNTAFFFHQVHLAEAKGWGHAALVALFPLFTATSVASMLAGGWLVDRFSARRLVPYYLLPLAAGYAAFALAGGVPAGAAGMVLMGISVGLNVTMMATLWAELYGTRHLGGIRALTAAVMVLGTALGPGITGVLIDVGLDFPQQGWGIAAWFLLSGLLAARAMRVA